MKAIPEHLHQDPLIHGGRERLKPPPLEEAADQRKDAGRNPNRSIAALRRAQRGFHGVGFGIGATLEAAPGSGQNHKLHSPGDGGCCSAGMVQREGGVLLMSQ